MATKKSYIAKPSDTVDFDEVMRRIDAVPTAKPAEQPTGFLRTQADRGLALGQGVVGGVKMLTDLAGADNSVSQSLGSANKSLQGMYSPERQAEMANRQKLIEAADAGDSTLDQITTRLGGVKEAPVQTVLQAVGSMAPPIIAGLATGGMTTGAGVMASAARMGIPAVVGGGMGVGAVKGQNYEAVYNKSISDGLPDLEAKALAVRASEYSAQNAPQQAIAAGLGAVAASTGAEKLISAMARKGVVAQAPQGMLRSGAKGAVTEALPEGAQGAQGQYAQNEALNNAGYQTSPYAGVVGAGVTDAVVGSMIGGPLGAVQRQPVATSGPLARAASTIAPGTAEAMNAQNAPPVDTTLGVDPADDPIMGRISQLPDGAREDAAKAYAVLNNPKAAKGIQLYNKKLLDRLLEQDLKANPAVDQSISNQSAINNIAQISSLQTERTDPETGEITQAYDQRQLDAPRQEDGDVLNAENKPFTNMLSAKRTAQALGDGFQPIKLGKNAYVVRAKGAEPGPEAVTEQPAEAAALDAAPTAIAEGNANLPGGDGELLQTSSTEPGAVSLNAVDDTNPAAGAQFKTKTQAAQTPKAGKADEAGTTAAGAQARSATVEGDGVGREGYEKPFTVDAKSLKAVIEKEAGVPDNLNLDKLEAVRNGAKSSGNIELAIKQGTGKGDIGVNDGRHRIAVAAERGEKITAFASDEDVIEIQSKLKAAVEGATVNTKAATAKLIPDMSDAELTALQDHYGPDHKRTPKLQKELEKRASNQAPTQSNQAQAAPENVAKSLNSPNSPNLVDAKQPPAAEVAPDFTKDLADGRAGLAELEKKRKLTRSSKRADIDGQITRLKATMAEMKTSQVESGIPLADETPDLAVQRAEAAKRETQRKAKASRLRGYTYDKSPFLAFLGKHGVALSRKADFSPDKNPMLSGYGPMFRNSGKNTDLLVQNAIEENFLPERATSDELENLISQQISGKRIEAIYSPEVADRVMNERMAEAQDAFQEELAVQQEAAQNADFDPFAPLGELDYAQEDADASGYSNAEQALQLKINALLLTAEKQGIDTQEIKDQAYDDTREGTTQDYLNAARAALKSAIEGSNGDSSQDAGKQGDAGSQSSQGLTAPTQQDVLDQQDRKNNTEALDQKEQIDREVSGQTLTSQAAPEQRTDTSGDMFEREKAEAEIAKRNVGRVQDSDPNQPMMFSRADVALVGPMSPSPSKTPLYEAFRQLSRFDKSFQLRDSASADLAQIATDMQAGRGKSLVFTADTDSTALHQGNRKPTISLRIPDANGVSQKLLDIFEADSERPFVVIGNSELGQKIDGAAAYQIAFAWAHNNGKTMRPDPAGLTVINRLRRTEAMVSSALHFGTTKHLEPHQDQYIALTKKALTDKKESEDTHYSGNPDVFNELEALKNKLWTKKTDADSIALNVQNLIEASAQLAALREPALRTFIVIDGTLRKRGVAAQIPLADVVADSKAGEVKIHGVVLRPASSGVGSSTLKRYAVAASTGRAVQQANAGSVQRIDGKDGSVGSTPDIAALRAIRAVLGDFSGKTSGELDGVLYSRNAGNPQAVQSTAEVEKITTGITSRWANAPEVVVVYDMQDPRIPAKVRAQDLEQRSGGATGDPEGFFLGGKVYILASQVSTPKDVARVLFHESLGHYGLRGVFGEQLKPILQQLAGLRKPMVEAKAKQYGLDMKDESQRLQAAEEVLAEMAQTRLELGFVKRAIAIIRSWLRRNLPGFKNMALTDADIIANYIIPARGWVERGQSSNEGGMVPAFSRGTNDVVTNPKDVVGNQGGRSADDTTPGAAFDAQAAFERHGGTNDVDESTDITAKSQAFADMAEAAGYTVVGRGDKYVVVKKDFGKDADGYEQEAAIKVRISDHSNVNRGYHFGDTDINIAPDDGYSRDTFYDALRKLQAAYVDSDGNTVIPNEPTAPDSGGALNTTLKTKAFFSGTQYDRGVANPGKAKADAESVLGFKSSVPVLVENRPEMARTPMRYDLQQGVILYNKAVKRTAAADVEYMIEEILHAINHVGGSKTISASSARLQKGGDLRVELQAAYRKSAAMKDKLEHPLDEPELHDSVVRAELYARSAMLYHSNPQLLRVTAPQTYEAHRATFARQADQDRVSADVRGLRPAGIKTGQPRIGGDIVSDASGTGNLDQNTAGLAGLRQRIADGFGGRVDGAEVNFNGSGSSLNSSGGGDFDPVNPDIRFSRSLANAVNNPQDLKLPAGYIVNDFFKSEGKLSWWHKTIGTQYNLAQRNPQFKPVFDGVQNFINDVSFYATKAADRAPSILPKLESWNDIAKSPLSAADNKAIAAPIFEGTLTWSRDEDGKPVKASDIQAKATKMSAADKAQRLFREGKINESLLKMWQGLPVEQFEKIIGGKYASEFLKAGIVFTPAELKSLFNLTDAQVALYSEFRAATDKSLTDLAVADMIRFGGDDVASIKDVALDAGDVDAAAVMLRDHLLEMADGSARSDVLIDTANKMIDKADRARDLMNRGYAPLSRFGSYSLDVLDETGGRVYFGLFESKAEANKMARQMRANFPQGTISQGTMSDEEYKLFAGVSPETVELFGEMLGLESGQDGAANQAFQQYLKLAKANRSAMKRLIERKGIAGFSEDPGRVLAGFVYSNARQTSSGLHMGGIAQAVSDIPKGQGELKDAAMRLTEYIKNPQEEAQAIRGLLFAQYLGGSIASAIVNMTQPMNVTFPWLSQYGGVMKAAGQMKNAMRDALKKDTGDTALDAALKKAEEDGIVSPQEVFQLMAQAQGKSTLKSGDGTTAGDALAKGSNALSKLSLAWGKVFGVAEQFNRRTTFIAAYRTAIDQKLGDPAAFAEKAVNETQFVYGKGSKPRWARGAVGGTLFTFKSYSINYVELLSRMAANGPEGKKAALLAVGMLFMMAGSGGLPFADDLDDVVDGLLQRMGYNFSSKRAKQEFFINLLGKDGAQFVERGISGLAGVPIDLSGRLGMGNLIPGTGLLTKKDNYTRDLTELLGPAGDLAKRTFEATGKLVDGNVLSRTGAMATMSPVATRNVIQAMDMANTGMYRDATGKKIIDTDSYDAFAKGIGFQPNDVARVQSATRQVQNMIAQSKLREKEIADSWALGIFEKDDDKVQAARDSLKRWNESNPDAKIVIAMPQIIKRVRAMREDKTTRIAKTAPKEIRATVRRELEGER